MFFLSKKANLTWTIATLSLTLVIGCSSSKPNTSTLNSQNEQVKNVQQNTTTSTPASPSKSTLENLVIYKNSQYDFSFTLPESWKGYSIVTASWGGADTKTSTVLATGPIISIRHPQWTPENQRQDIPIMIFTVDQWNSLQEGKYHIGPAPINPSELARSNKYVFAIPARYNYAFPVGYKEVEQILANHPLKITQPADLTTNLFINMMELAEQGKVINCAFRTRTDINTVEKTWGKPEQSVYVATAKGRYDTYTSHDVVFGINKDDVIFEVRSLERHQFLNITKAKTENVLGNPAYDKVYNGQEIIGYVANEELKLEMVFPQPTINNPNPPMNHYNVLSPSGTTDVESGDFKERQW